MYIRLGECGWLVWSGDLGTLHSLQKVTLTRFSKTPHTRIVVAPRVVDVVLLVLAQQIHLHKGLSSL